MPAKVLCTGTGDNTAPAGGFGIGGAHGRAGGGGGGGVAAVIGDTVSALAGGSVTAANAPVRRSRGIARRRTKADRSARARLSRPPRIACSAAFISATLPNRRSRSGCSARVTISCSRGSLGGG